MIEHHDPMIAFVTRKLVLPYGFECAVFGSWRFGAHQRLALIWAARPALMPSTKINSSSVASRMAATEPNCLIRAFFFFGPIPGILSRLEVKVCFDRFWRWNDTANR